MHSCTLPPISTLEAYEACTDYMRFHQKKSIMQALQLIVEDDATKFQDEMKNDPPLLPIPRLIRNPELRQELKNNYTNRLLKIKNIRGRSIYNKIFLSAYKNRCPFCSARQVETLDHFLPKSKFSTLSVEPSNLVPCCYKCNFNKNNRAPTTVDELLIHPYFHASQLMKIIWLKATITQYKHPVEVSYSVITSGLDQVLSNRIRFTFKELELNDIYQHSANNELSALKDFHHDKYTKIGASGLQKLIKLATLGHESVNLNSWQSALYRELASSHQYCNLTFQ